jgi:hypothetical protein
VIWLMQAKRDFGSWVTDTVRLDVRFYDADDARIYSARLDFDPNGDVRRGERIRISLALPAEEVRRRTRSVLMLRPEDREFTDHPEPKLVAGDGHPRGKATWDMAPLQKHFAILRTSHNEEVNRVIWLVQAKRGFGAWVTDTVRLDVRFYDADDARIYNTRLDFDPNGGVLKGERIRISLALPAEEVRRRTRSVRMLRPEDVEFTSHPGPALKASAGQPAGKATWDTTPLQPYFTILRTSTDAEARRVIWLVQAKRGFGSWVSDVVRHRARFYDAGSVRVHDAVITFDPNHDVRKGERIRIWVPLPADDVLNRTAKVLLEKP